jgi:subtilase family serine protease
LIRHKLALLGVFLFAASALSVIPAGASLLPATRHVLPDTKPSWTGSVKQTGALAAGQRVTARVWLTPRNASGLDALATAVSDPASALYGRFITSAQYDRQFAPSAAQVTSVTAWLSSFGVGVTAVGPGNTFVSAAGTAAAFNAALNTKLAHFLVKGKSEQAPTQDVSIPSSLAGTVMAITGLSTLGHLVTPADFGAPSGFANATPCSSYYGQKVATTLPKFNGKTLPYAPCGYVPSQLRSTYGVGQAGGLGKGQTVAITDAFDSPRLLSDANTYATNRGDSAFKAGQFSDLSVPEVPTPFTDANGDPIPGTDQCGGNGWYGEQNLDVEAVHGMAPKANVLYYGAASCFDSDLLAQLAQVVQDNKASIVTNSWGEPTFVVICDVNGANCQTFATIDQSTINAYESVFKHGAVQGIGFYFSSGDNGDELAAWGVKHPDWPTGDPWVTSVGGTSLAVSQNGHRLFETGWGTSQWRLNSDGSAWSNNVLAFQYGSGGGFSQVFAQPSYQRHVVKNNPTGGRAVPDIGLVGDPTTGMLIGITQDFALPSAFGPAGVHYGEFRIGGTSLSSPLLAGIQADAQSGRERIGFANPLIYSLARGEDNVYYDVTSQGALGNIRSDFKNGYNADGGIRYSVRTFNQDSSLVIGRGWDDVTGVGTVTARYIEAVSGGDRGNNQ